MAGGATSSRSLEETPTWAVATTFFVIISISIILEHSIHLLTSWLKKHHHTALCDAVERIKSELMQLGFMSLILAVTRIKISNICIPTQVANSMRPCHKDAETRTGKVGGHGLSTTEKLQKVYEHGPWQPHRLLGGSDNDASGRCSSKGMVSLMSQDGVHQLHIFIFVLAVMQITYSVLTMALGRAKMSRWKAWESETQTAEYQVANDPNRFRLTRQTTFARRHIDPCTEGLVLLWIKCFFRQFFSPVAKVDYLTLRHGFISAHLSPNKIFNFQKYIQRSLEEDFKVVVSISPLLWLVVVILMLINFHGWHMYLWLSYLPLIMLLILGTKLEVIIARMALRLKDQSTVIKGLPLVQLNDEFFWFRSPKFALKLLHLILFMNAFELAFFVWVVIEFGLNSCYHEYSEVVVARILVIVTVQVICSYITLPLYALVTQMGSRFKNEALEAQIAEALKQWHAEVREKRKKAQQLSESPQSTLSTVCNPKSTSHIEFSSVLSPRPSHNLAEATTSHGSNEITEEQEITRDGPSPTGNPPRVVQFKISG